VQQGASAADLLADAHDVHLDALGLDLGDVLAVEDEPVVAQRDLVAVGDGDRAPDLDAVDEGPGGRVEVGEPALSVVQPDHSVMAGDRGRREDQVVVLGPPDLDLSVLLEQPGDVVVLHLEVPRQTLGLSRLRRLADRRGKGGHLLEQGRKLVGGEREQMRGGLGPHRRERATLLHERDLAEEAARSEAAQLALLPREDARGHHGARADDVEAIGDVALPDDDLPRRHVDRAQRRRDALYDRWGDTAKQAHPSEDPLDPASV
jgi:hypothetical protein